MKPQCQLCLVNFTPLVSKSSSPVVPLCGHVICSDCLQTRMKGKPCYLRCGVVKVKDIRSIRLGYIDTELPNWKQILDSKSYKRLQELNLALNKQAMLLDDERATLAATLQDYLAGATLEQVLCELCTELKELEAQDVALHQQITYEIHKLDRLGQKITQIRIGGDSQGRGGCKDKAVSDA